MGLVERHRPHTPTESGLTQEILSQPHHEYIDLVLKKVMATHQFKVFLDITKNHFNGLNPVGEIPVFDEDVIQEVGKITGYYTEKLHLGKITEEEFQTIKSSAYFAIWAYGTNPKEKKRFRVETKPDTQDSQPYAIHPIRVAENLMRLDLDPRTISAALLHDVVEDTLYTVEDIDLLFSNDIACDVEAVTKISGNSILDIGQIEIGTALEFLKQYPGDENAMKVSQLLMEFLKQYPGDENAIKISQVLDGARGYPKRVSDLDSTSIDLIREFASDADKWQVLTNMRILSTASDPDGIRPLFIKISDCVDNSESYPKLLGVKDNKKVAAKAELSRDLYAPIADMLGMYDMARRIRNNVFLFQDPQNAQRVEHYKMESSRMTRDQNKKVRADLDNLLFWFSIYAQRRGVTDVSKIYWSFYQLTDEEIYKSLKNTSKPAYLLPGIRICMPNDHVISSWDEYLKIREVQDGQPFIKVEDKEEHKVKTGDNLTRSFEFRPLVSYRDLRQRSKFTGQIVNTSGSIIDFFRMDATESQRVNGRDRLVNFVKNYKSGEFLARISTGSVAVRIMREKQNMGSAQLSFFEKGATLKDLYVLFGNTNKLAIQRDGKKLTEGELKAGDTIIRSWDRPQSEIDWLDPGLIDELNTQSSRRIVLARNRESSKVLDEKEMQRKRENAARRAYRVLSILTDAHVIQETYSSPRGTGDIKLFLYGDGMFESILREASRELENIFSSDFIQLLGNREVQFVPDQSELTVSKFEDWMGFKGTGKKIEEFTEWLDDACIYIPFYGQDAQSDPYYISQLLKKIYGRVVVVESSLSTLGKTTHTARYITDPENQNSFQESFRVVKAGIPLDIIQRGKKIEEGGFFLVLDINALREISEKVYPGEENLKKIKDLLFGSYEHVII